MKTMNPTHAKRILRLPLFALMLLTGLLSMPSAYAVNCSTSYFCYKTMTPQATSRMPMSHPNRNWVRRTADDQRHNRASRDETELRSRNTNPRAAQQQNRRPATPQSRQRSTQARNTPPQLRPTPANNNRRPATNLARCLDARADLMKRAKSVESQAITQAKQKNQTNAARLFRTAETMRKNAQNMRCR